MTPIFRFSRRSVLTCLAAATLACSVALPAIAAVEVGGYRFEDTTRVAGKDLKRNGAGVRTKFVIKVYAAALYLPEKANSVPAILQQEGPRRMILQMARDVSSEDFGKAFMEGLNENVSEAEQQKIMDQLGKFGRMFAGVDHLKKGDKLHIDWIPGSGTVCELNGKKLIENVPDVQFYNALLKIWLGDKPVDGTLKLALLGNAK